MLPTLTPPQFKPVAFVDAYAAVRSTVTSAAEVGRVWGPKLQAGDMFVYMACWLEVGPHRIPFGVVRLLPAAWSDDFGDNFAAWFDVDSCKVPADAARLLHEARSNGRGITIDQKLRNMCRGPVYRDTKDGERVVLDAICDPTELARALPEIWAPSPPTSEDVLVTRMVVILEAQPKTKISAAELYVKAAAQRPRLTVRTKDDRAGQANVPAPSGRAGRLLIRRGRQRARSPRAT